MKAGDPCGRLCGMPGGALAPPVRLVFVACPWRAEDQADGLAHLVDAAGETIQFLVFIKARSQGEASFCLPRVVLSELR